MSESLLWDSCGHHRAHLWAKWGGGTNRFEGVRNGLRHQDANESIEWKLMKEARRWQQEGNELLDR